MVPIEKWSDLPAASAPAGGNTVVGLQGGVAVQYSFPQVASWAWASPSFTGTITMPDGVTWGAAGAAGTINLTGNMNAGYQCFKATNANTGTSAFLQFELDNNVGSCSVGLAGGNWTPGVFNTNPNDMYVNNTVGAIRFKTGPSGAQGVYIDYNTGQVVLSPGFTVGTLPAGVLGARAYVTDATSPTFLGALTGGGSVKCPVFFNGSAWVAG